MVMYHEGEKVLRIAVQRVYFVFDLGIDSTNFGQQINDCCLLIAIFGVKG